MVTTNNPNNLSINNTLKTKHNKQSNNLSIKNAPKTNHYYKHNNPPHHTPRFVNIKIIVG